jgi:hypothetical protein
MTFGMQLEKQAERNLARDAADSAAFKRFKEAETARLIAEKDAIRLERKQQAQKIRGLWFQLTGLDQHAATLPQEDDRYDLQQRIHEFNPGDRIEFRDLVRQLQKHLDDLHSNIDMSGEECTNDQDSLKSDSPSPEPPSRKNTAKKILDALAPTPALRVEDLLGDAQGDGHNVTKPKKKKKKKRKTDAEKDMIDHMRMRALEMDAELLNGKTLGSPEKKRAKKKKRLTVAGLALANTQTEHVTAEHNSSEESVEEPKRKKKRKQKIYTSATHSAPAHATSAAQKTRFTQEVAAEVQKLLLAQKRKETQKYRLRRQQGKMNVRLHNWKNAMRRNFTPGQSAKALAPFTIPRTRIHEVHKQY